MFVAALSHVGVLVLLSFLMENESLFLLALLAAFVSGGIASFLAARQEADGFWTGVGFGAVLTLVCGILGFLTGYLFQFAFQDPWAGLGFIVVLLLVGVSVPALLLGGALGGHFG